MDTTVDKLSVSGDLKKRPSTSFMRLAEALGSLMSVRRHPYYYYHDGSVVLQVENTLFKLHKSILARESEFFCALFDIRSNDAEVAGDSDEKPLQLSNVSVEEFEWLLAAVYPSVDSRRMDKQNIVTILRLSDRWNFKAIRTYAIRELDGHALDPFEKMELAEYGCSEWKLQSLLELSRPGRDLTLEEGQRLGLQTVMKIFQAKRWILSRRFMRTAVEPSSDLFPAVSRNHEACWTSVRGILAEESTGSNENVVTAVHHALMAQSCDTLCTTCQSEDITEEDIEKCLDLKGEVDIVKFLFDL